MESPQPGCSEMLSGTCASAPRRTPIFARSGRTVAVALVGFTALLAGCGGSTKQSVQPKTLEAAIAAQQEKQDRGQAGDFAGEWLLFTKKVRDRLSQADYVTYAKACYTTSNPVKVTGGRMEGDDKAIVRLESQGTQVIRTMTYEDGQWVQEPLDNWYEKPVSELIAECGSGSATTASKTPKQEPAKEPIQETEQFQKLYDAADAAYGPCKDKALGSLVPECRAAITATVEKLRDLKASLPVEYAETTSETQKQIDQLQGMLDCRGLRSDTNPGGCPIYLISGQLLQVAAAWGGRDSLIWPQCDGLIWPRLVGGGVLL